MASRAIQAEAEEGVVEAIAELSVKDLKSIIDEAGLSRTACIEKDDLRARALEAVLAGAPLPRAQAVTTAPPPAADAASPKTEPTPESKQELALSWTDRALRIQLDMVGQPPLPDATHAGLVDAYWAFLVAEGSADGEEYARRWLRISTLDRETQARYFVEALTGERLPEGGSLHAALQSGERLCDMINVLLEPVGFKTIKPFRASDPSSELGQAAASRQRAKQMENISLYIQACLELGVPKTSTFDGGDLYDAKGVPSVVKNIHAVAQHAQKLADYRGPLMGPVQRKDKAWVQRASVVATDWRTNAGAMDGMRQRKDRVLVGPEGGVYKAPAAPIAEDGDAPGEGYEGGVEAAKAPAVTVSEVAVDGVDIPTPLPTPPASSPGGDTGEGDSAMDEVLAHPEWRGKYTYVDVAGEPDDEAALRWIEAVLHMSLPRPLLEALRSGSVLCRLLNALEPDTVEQKKLLVESTKPFERMAAVDAYLRGAAKLGVTKAVFVTVDLTEGRDVRAVTRQIWELALRARTHTTFVWRGPHLGKVAQQQAAKLAIEQREKVERRLEREREKERRRIEKDMYAEEVEAERVLVEALVAQREQMLAIEEKRVAEQKQSIVDAREAAKLEKERLAAEAIRRHSISGWMYKRGGMAKMWRKRWFVIDGGELAYYTSDEEAKAFKAPLGVLVLTNAAVRRPTDPKSKGKFQSTALRLDLDSDVQLSGRPRGSSESQRASQHAEGADDGEGAGDDKEERHEEASTSAVKDKYKYLLAAVSVQALSDWMTAIDFWSAKHGNDKRRSVIALSVTAEEEAAIRSQGKYVPRLSVIYGSGASAKSAYMDDDDDEEDEDEAQAAALEAQTAAKAAAVAAEFTIPGAPPGKQELMSWSVFALRYQIRLMSERVHGPSAPASVPAEGASRKELVEAYWGLLVHAGQADTEAARRWLILPKDADQEAQARTWLQCLLGIELPPGPLQPLLRSGELLCELVNAIKSGVVPKIARAELLAAMTEQRRNARMRENIGQYVDACAELGVDQKDLFITADLFEAKNWKAVLRSIHGLARIAHYSIPDFYGPHIGIRKKAGASGSRFAEVALLAKLGATSGMGAAGAAASSTLPARGRLGTGLMASAVGGSAKSAHWRALQQSMKPVATTADVADEGDGGDDDKMPIRTTAL